MGGTRGIGAAISRSLATQGAAVAAGYSRNRDQAQEFRHALEPLGVDASIHQGSVAACEDCQRMVRETIEQRGRLEVPVSNAGITGQV
jgi:3-oxoacyl-[acyl-carrier protein] reductase